MAFVSLPLSLFMRLGADIEYYDPAAIGIAAIIFAVIAMVIFWSMDLYRGVWRYASLNDLSAITRAVTFVILIFVPAMLWSASRREIWRVDDVMALSLPS